jgi:hypothetical protein
MDNSAQNSTCSRNGCHASDVDGCIDGLPPKECPNRHPFAVPQDTVIEKFEQLQIDTVPAGLVRMHNGEAYTSEETDAFLRRKKATVVAFLGCPDSGKTTAAVMLYELLKRRRLQGLGFAGSNTIRGFQRRSFKSLITSGLQVPDTDRTSRNQPVQFLHLRICTDQSTHEMHEVILSDRTGEDFEACIAKPDLCASYPEIPRADWHVLLVDGRKLIQDDTAALHISNVRKIYSSLIKTPIKNLQIVLTKFDKVSSSDNKDTALNRFDTLVADLIRRACGKFQVTTHNLAARPTSDGDFTGFGLDEVVLQWFPERENSSFARKHIPILVQGSPYDMLLNTLNLRGHDAK